ncbi:MAG TPA: hypothetical protein VFV83_03205 [Chthoniobacteraceae bacterium]|nr:hypothetical protein [Chthoniobacteraceae bacterium]
MLAIPAGAALLVVLIAFVAWRVRQDRAPSHISPAEALAIAESYVAHEWVPSEANIFHGVDPDGIRVDTLDASFQSGKDERGWWIAAQRNIGIPYKWGGFDTPEEFDAGIRAGRYGGDAYSAEKRRLLDAAVSTHAVGIDCSGFVSRCWRLPRSYSTRELPQLCVPVRDFDDLRAGDIFNRHNAHVRLFAQWADPAHTRVRVYEAKARVQVSDIPLQSLIGEGYSAWRYRGMQAE